MTTCPTCGNAVSPEATVCPDCGMDLKSIDTPAVTPAPPPAVTPPVVTPPAEPIPEETTPAASEPAGLAILTLKRAGVLTSEKFFIGDNVVLGRFDPESGPVDVDFAPLPEATYISRHHAHLRRGEDDQWTIQDLGSRNGTFLQARGTAQFARISGQHVVADGDEIALGNARFLFSILDSSNSSSVTDSEGSSC